MKNLLILVALILAVRLAYAQIPQSDRIILKIKDDHILRPGISYRQNFLRKQKIDSITSAFKVKEIVPHRTGNEAKEHFYSIKFPPGTDLQPIIDAYYKTGDVELAEPDYIGTGGGVLGTTPNDPYYLRQWGLKNDGKFFSNSTAGADINMENAWSITKGDTNVVVAIIDSGAKLDHPEFYNRIWINKKEVANNNQDDDQNGYIDDTAGWDFVNSDNVPADDLGHGTNVAGIIGANANNSLGYAGVNWHCKLMILKAISNNNNGYYSWFADAIYYAVDNGAKVVNMSLGGSGYSQSLQTAVAYAISHNVVVVACMMNTNSDTPYYPAALSDVIAVGSTNPNDERTHPFFWDPASGSNYGDHISVVAPGNYIYGLDYQADTNYNSYWGGTSQAAPLVAGLASLLLSQDSHRTPKDIKTIIEATAQDHVGNPTEDLVGWDRYYGHGRIDAYQAVLTPVVGVLENPTSALKVYPNPCRRELSIENEGKTEIKIINMNGIEVFHTGIVGPEILLLDIPTGLYLLRTINDHGTTTSKLIKE